MIKMIAMDMDGTLLNSHHEISPKTKDVLLKAQDQGIWIMLASGRPLPGLLHQTELMGLAKKNLYLLAYNGAMVLDANEHHVIISDTFEIPLAQSILDHLRSYDVSAMVYDDDVLYTTNPTGVSVQHEAKSNGLTVETNDLDAIWFRPHKILVSADPVYLDSIKEEIIKPFVGQADFVKSAPFYLECLIKDVNKGEALEQFCNVMRISIEDVIAFGDNYNDETLLQKAGIGVAMGNAVDALKAVADEITLSNDEDGIAVSLLKRGILQ